MHFQSPALLPWSLLLVFAALLYLFRRRPKRFRVSTLPFFKSLAAVYQESAWLRRLKKLLSFALTAVIVLGSVGALAHAVVAPSSEELHSIVILVDGSASMAAADAEGKTRLDAAKAWIRERLPGVPPAVEILVMRYDRHPEILLPHTYDRRAVERALTDLKIRPVEGDPRPALALARRLAALRAPATIWHLTDTPAGWVPAEEKTDGDDDDDAADDVPAPPGEERPAKTESKTAESKTAESKTAEAEKTDAKTDAPAPSGEEAKVTLRTINLGLARPVNVGITAFQMRRLPLEHARLEAFVQLHARAASPDGQSDEPIEAKLEMRLDKTLVAVRELTLTPGKSERLLVPINASGAGEKPVLTLRVRAEGDVLPTDDVVHARVPASRPIRVLWLAKEDTLDPFTQLALRVLGESGTVEPLLAPPASWPVTDQTFDVVIFDGWLPDTWPTDVQAIVLDPPGSKGPVQAVRLEKPLPLEKLRAIEESHPLLYGVSSARVALTQTAVLNTSGPLTPIWVGQAGPVLAAGEVKGQRLVVGAFSAQRSEHLGYMASYPLLLGNAIMWLMQPQAAARSGNNFQTGHVVERAGDTITWTVPGLRQDEVETVPRIGQLTELDRVGLWTIGDMEGSASLLSKTETRLVPNPAATATAEEETQGGGLALLKGDLRPLLLWCVLIALLLEAWLFHRYAVY